MTGPRSRCQQLITKKFKEMGNGLQCNECPRGALFTYGLFKDSEGGRGRMTWRTPTH